jgi:hypothetical protein
MDKATTNVSTLNAIPRTEVGPLFKRCRLGPFSLPHRIRHGAFDALESTAARQCAESHSRPATMRSARRPP